MKLSIDSREERALVDRRIWNLVRLRHPLLREEFVSSTRSRLSYRRCSKLFAIQEDSESDIWHAFRRYSTNGRRARIAWRTAVPVNSDVVLAHVRICRDERGEEIAAELGIDTKTLRGPMKRLIAAGQVHTKGERRGMQYWAGPPG